MDARIISFLLICIVAAATAGCTDGSPPAATPAPAPSPSAAVVPATPGDAQACTIDTDCVSAECCHPKSCTGKAAVPPCDTVMCTMSCEGPIDCGAGSCRCVNGKCRVVPARTTPDLPAPAPSIRLEASPRRYSPMMSSTPGIGLAVNASGFTPADARFAWTATYGQFLSWNAPDYLVNQLGNTVINHGDTLYWTFTEKPASTKDPVTVTVTAKDSRTGVVLGSSMVTLSWNGDYAVMVWDVR